MPTPFTPAAARLAGLMGALFHWTPEQFWAATPQEVAALFEALAELRGKGAEAAGPPDADTLAALMRRFPD